MLIYYVRKPGSGEKFSTFGIIVVDVYCEQEFLR
jgi:hypothetical protein